MAFLFSSDCFRRTSCQLVQKLRRKDKLAACPTRLFMFRYLLAALFLGTLATTTLADNWPQWMGSARDGVWRESGILEKFPENGPAIKWRTKIGGGYAGPAVAGERVYVMDYIRTAGDAKPDPNARSE